jgi:WD40 repeat protein
MSCSLDGSLRVWDLQSEQKMGIDWRDGESAVYAIRLSPDGKKIVSGCEDGAVRLWDVDTGKVIAKWTGHTSRVRSVCWSQDGGTVVSGSDDGTARVWDVESGKTVRAMETGLTAVCAVIYSPDTTMIATGGYNYSELEYVKIWDAKTGKLVANLKGHRSQVNCLAWTADGKTLISGSNSLRTWNTATWEQIAILTGHTRDIAISPNGRILASASLDNTAQLWNLENSQPIGWPLQHDHLVYCVSFSTDGKLLATGCHDKNAYTWDISAIAHEAGFSDLLNPNVCSPFLIPLYQLNTLSQETSDVCDTFINPHPV